MEIFSIGQVARRASAGVETVRFKEILELLTLRVDGATSCEQVNRSF